MKHKNAYIDFLRSELIDIMAEKKITQSFLARKMKCDQSTISKFIKGTRGLSGEIAIRLQQFVTSQRNNITL